MYKPISTANVFVTNDLFHQLALGWPLNQPLGIPLTVALILNYDQSASRVRNAYGNKEHTQNRTIFWAFLPADDPESVVHVPSAKPFTSQY